MRRMKTLVILAVIGIAVGCGHERRTLRDGEIKDVLEAQSDSEYIRTLGIGIAPAEVLGDTRKKGLARNAALTQARFELAALLRGVRLKGGVTVSMLEQRDSEIKEQMDQLIAGAEETQVEFTRDGGAVVIVQIARRKVERMLEEVATREATTFRRRSLNKRVRQSDARSRERRSRLPGMSD